MSVMLRYSPNADVAPNRRPSVRHRVRWHLQLLLTRCETHKLGSNFSSWRAGLGIKREMYMERRGISPFRAAYKHLSEIEEAIRVARDVYVSVAHLHRVAATVSQQLMREHHRPRIGRCLELHGVLCHRCILK